MPLSTIPAALEDLRAGKMIILVDDPGRENEGDVAMLAEHVTPEAINFMAKEARGLICMPMGEALCDQLDLPPQAHENQSRMGTAFTVSIEAREGVTTGISAADRAHTIKVAAAEGASATDLARPGHIFPLRAKDGGVLVRGGQTEGIVDLARLAGGRPAGVICEVMKDDGTMARMPDLEVFAKQHDLRIVTIADLIAYRRQTERLIEAVEMDTPLPTRFGNFRAHLFRSKLDGREHVALTTEAMPGPGLDGPREAVDEVVTVRVHSECLTGDVFHSLRCDCGTQLDQALQTLAAQKYGVLVYMRQEGRGIGLAAKLKAYRLQDEGMDTVEANQALGYAADLREYGLGAQMLTYLGVRRMRLLTNNPKKIAGLEGYGLSVEDQVPLKTEPNSFNTRYLQTKRDKLGHLLGEIKETLG
ncbi:bifunctional 3,4-dihydroxy-2-butanone-4-phosphate synthase/GTP cyclohydrolase II [Engelhardtia mirabilis]|uniref:Riboflavin biosynthesis protein RibBA n=1 Tax=Engelhardtia mirabilis TaxID=2528011 RepID=A0A518BSL8_9BACT|nr:Riboflavin biosynthesis protein RibBA [Planctomycetes bacterium Pla133]QDV04284.1 Riboflavin biosynthesis protein RibBA [Planctomycetes bacterium Pla86]